ncbi:MAG: caspase family protein [Longimicrobiaceae bacterium]
MDRAVSVHVGVNQPRERSPGDPLKHSEATAWRMAELAHQAGYRSLRVLQGPEATRQAVHDALAGAASALENGDILFVSFSGHGTRLRDFGAKQDERDPWDEAWCLYDSMLVDDQLAGYWRLFNAGVRILVVSESCYGGGMGRWEDRSAAQGSMAAGRRPARVLRRPRRSPPGAEDASSPTAPCIMRAPRDADGIQASLLLLSACREDQLAQDGLFSGKLFDVWNQGAFDGSLCELYRQVRKRVMADPCKQEPRIQMFGTDDPRFSIEPAIKLGRRTAGRRPGRR